MIGRLLGRRRYERESRRARRNLRAAVEYDRRDAQTWDRVIDVAAAERERDDAHEPLFPPDR